MPIAPVRQPDPFPGSAPIDPMRAPLLPHRPRPFLSPTTRKVCAVACCLFASTLAGLALYILIVKHGEDCPGSKDPSDCIFAPAP
jgi:hypothetical protein